MLSFKTLVSNVNLLPLLPYVLAVTELSPSARLTLARLRRLAFVPLALSLYFLLAMCVERSGEYIGSFGISLIEAGCLNRTATKEVRSLVSGAGQHT